MPIPVRGKFTGKLFSQEELAAQYEPQKVGKK
jgi:hypothetical protein